MSGVGRRGGGGTPHLRRRRRHLAGRTVSRAHFVLTHRQHEDLVMPSGTFTFVTSGVVDAVDAAQAAAGERKVFVMGGAAAQQALAAGLVDEVQVNWSRCCWGSGVRMFDGLGAYPIELVQTRVDRIRNAATHVRYPAGRPLDPGTERAG